MPVKIHGNDYLTVAERVTAFRKEFGHDLSIKTKLVHNGQFIIIKTKIIDKDGRTIATGYAEEQRDSSQINRTSALENCETSSIGRALACLGLVGSEYRSANEMMAALYQQANPNSPKAAPIDDGSTLDAKYADEKAQEVATLINDGDLISAKEVWDSMSEADQRYSWRAQKDGGYLTTAHKKAIKEDF